MEQRRWELEQWLWRLTESPLVANSIMIYHFLELDSAARVRPRSSAALTPPDHSGAPFLDLAGAAGSSAQLSSPRHSYAPSWSGSEVSELYPDSSSSSLAAAAAAAATLGDSPARPPHHHHSSSQGHPPRHTPPRAHASGLHAISDSHSEGSGMQLPMHAATQAAAAAGLAGSGQLRLALPVQQRGAAKAAVRQLREQLVTAHADLQGALCSLAAVCLLCGCL